MPILGRTRRICDACNVAPQKLRSQQRKAISLEMAVKDHQDADLMALFVSAGLVVFSFRCVAGKNQSKSAGMENFEVSANRTRLSSYLTVILIGLLLVTVS